MPISAESTESELNSLEPLFAYIQAGKKPVNLRGLTPSAKAFLLVQIWRTLYRPLVVLVPDTHAGENLLSDLRYFFRHHHLKQMPRLFPDWGLLPYEPLSPLRETSGERLDILNSLSTGHCPLLVLPVQAASHRVIPKQVLTDLTYRITVGDNLDRDLLELCLVDNGYERSHIIEERGQFSGRGDILDLFLPSHPQPVRIEFFGDEVESIRHFNITSQISFEEVRAVDVLPVREICLTQAQVERGIERMLEWAGEHQFNRSSLNESIEKLKCLKSFSGMEWLAPFFHDTHESIFNYIPADTLMVLDEEDLVYEAAQSQCGLALEEYDRCLLRGEVAAPPDRLFLEFDEFQERVQPRADFVFNSISLKDDPEDVLDFETSSLPSLYGHFDGFAAEARNWLDQEMRVTVVAPTKGHVSRFNELLCDKELNVPVEKGYLSNGFRWPGMKTVFVSEHEIFGRSHKHRKRHKTKSSSFQRGFQDLHPGDLLVHVDYGIGRYVRTKELKTGVGSGEFMEILYANDEKLYIPMDGLAAIQKYVGSGDDSPPLSKMGGISWKRQKKKIKESIRKMAEELVKIYAVRQIAEAQPYESDPVMIQEFSDSFEYVETEDQLNAIEEVLEDLGKEKPMDRLICGDVGYGKTEVAMRAAFKVVLDKKQVVVLVPTTILAQQHLHTFRERFKDWPVQVDMVSRFRSLREQKETLKKLKDGKVDIIIGTHRLLSKDVKFSDLGLLIIDEEQRFGVKHKEQMKKLRSSVDILTLTATPIPRTLHFSLMGLRDLSVIETPPSDRLAVKTYLRKFDESVIQESIQRELDRGGQIYFVHNKIQSIHSIAALIKKIVPHVRIGIAHGQLQEKMLETVMVQFLEKEIDLLLCTSIIESGLDIPSANTIIVNRADQFGLAQLYQLRGRVGRFNQQAYAVLLVPGAMAITPDARKRLVAIEEMSDLGAGFQLAARDMEIRGTGNMLGKDQSGHISAIGFDLYCKMMEETIREIRGEKVDSPIDPEIDIQIKGYIPKDYIPDLNQRLEVYRRLQLITDAEEQVSIANELKDRYGPPPEPVEKLLGLIELKLQCQKVHISKARLLHHEIFLDIESTTPLDQRALVELLDGNTRMASEFQIALKFGNLGWKETLRQLGEFLEKLNQVVADE